MMQIALADFSLYWQLKNSFKLYIFFPKSTPELIDCSMSRYLLNFSTQVVNFPPGLVQNQCSLNSAPR